MLHQANRNLTDHERPRLAPPLTMPPLCLMDHPNHINNIIPRTIRFRSLALGMYRMFVATWAPPPLKPLHHGRTICARSIWFTYWLSFVFTGQGSKSACATINKCGIETELLHDGDDLWMTPKSAAPWPLPRNATAQSTYEPKHAKWTEAP